MPSKLFTQASRAQQRTAARQYRRSPLGRAIMQLNDAAQRSPEQAATRRKRAQSRRTKNNLRKLKFFDSDQRAFGDAVVDLFATIQAGPEKYAQKSQKKQQQKATRAFDTLLSAFGPLGELMGQMLGTRKMTSPRSDIQQAYDAAVELIQTLGGEVIRKDATGADRKRGLDAARELLEEAGYTVISPEEAARKGVPPMTAPGPEPPATVGLGPEPRVVIQPALAPGLEPPTPSEAPEWSDEVNVATKSSNVWAFQYHYPSSTLRVTFKAPKLNPRSVSVARSKGGLSRVKGTLGKTITGKSNQPGPVYHYFDVPARVFMRLTKAGSPGAGVWDELRIRGTVYGHQYRYQLASGAIVQVGDGRMAAYVPRRATRKGFRSRSLAEVGRGKRRYMTSSLPEQLTATPGEPDRGLPDRGAPYRGR